MNLYLISQTQRSGFDTYDSAVVCAENEALARNMHPAWRSPQASDWSKLRYDESWATHPDQVTVKLIGEAAIGIPAGVVCASYNAG